jgi:hypothetical protein
VLRVRSEVEEIDSVTYLTMSFAVPRHYVDYKWLAAGEHYPALWITTTFVAGNETPSAVRYRDQRDLSIAGTSRAMESLQVYPNPAAGSEVNVKLPATWAYYVMHVYDATGKLLSSVANTPKINTAALPSGTYTIIAESNGQYGATHFVK